MLIDFSLISENLFDQLITGNIQLPNGAKLMVAPSNGALHPVVPRASNIHPKPASTSPVVIKVVPPPTKLSQGESKVNFPL